MGMQGWPQREARPGRAASLHPHRAMLFYVYVTKYLRFNWIKIKWIDMLEGPTVVNCAK